MDLRGITWVGHIYEKFEAMCLEAEEIIVQDTVNYVGNQAHKVGASVKKFYSDVMQDYLTESAVDPVKVTASDLSVEHYPHTGINMKPQAGKTENQVKVDIERLNEDSKVITNTGKNTGYPISSLKRHKADKLSSPYSEESVAGVGTDLYLRPYGNRRIYKKSNLGLKGKFKTKSLPATKTSGAITPVGQAFEEASPICETPNEIHEELYDQKAVVSTVTSTEVTRSGLVEKSCTETGHGSEGIPDASTGQPVSDMSSLTEPNENKEMEIRFSSCGALSAESTETEHGSEVIPDSSTDHPVSDMISLAEPNENREMEIMHSSCGALSADSTETEHGSEGIPDASTDQPVSDMSSLVEPKESKEMEMRLPFCGAESNAANVCTTSGVVSMVDSSTNENVHYNRFAGEDFSESGESNGWYIDEIGSDPVTEHEIESIQQFDKVKLEESCVVVNGDELLFVPGKERKYIPYKNKIRNAFSPRMRSARKQEYEQLAALHGCDSKHNQDCVETSMPALVKKDAVKSLRDCCESEWELL